MKLVKITDGHYVIVDDSEIKEGDYHFDFDKNEIHTWKGNLHSNRLKCKKITHSTNILTNGMGILYLSEVKELIGEVDVKKKAEYYYDMMYFMAKDDNIKLYVVRDYVTAYNQAIEDNKEKKYTEEDMRKAIAVGYDWCHQKHIPTNWMIDNFIQSLQPKTEWDVEFDLQGKLKLV